MALIVFVTAAQAARALDLKDLNVPASRIPNWYAFDEGTYNAARSWPEYDVTCSSSPCASGKSPFMADPKLARACSAVSTSDFSQMDCMVDNASDNSALYLPAGTYSVAKGEAMTIARSNIVVRGAGRNQTILSRDALGGEAVNSGFCTSGSAAMIASLCSPTYTSNSVDWIAGYSANDTVVTVSDASAFSVGGWVYLWMDGNIECETVNEAAFGGERGIFIHIAKITDISGNNLTMDRGLRMDYAEPGCTGHKAYVYTPIENVGIEELRATTGPAIPACVGNSPGTSCIRENFFYFRGTVGSWLVNTRVDRTYEAWLVVQRSARLWIQGNDFEDLDEELSYNTEAVHPQSGAVDIVIENNTCQGSRVCFNSGYGAEGIVWSYNYTRQNVCERSAFNHGNYVREVLFEGNDVDCNLLIADDYWAGNGPRLTAYRNRNSSTQCAGSRSGIRGRGPSLIGFDGHSEGGVAFFSALYPNVIGNIAQEFVNTPVMHSETCATEGSDGHFTLSEVTKEMWFERNIWRKTDGTRYPPFDWGEGNNRSCGVAANDACPGTNAGGLSAPAAWDALSFPTSLYRGSAPSWWCQEACAWSQDGIGAFGDDFSDVNTLCKLPAQIRHEGGTCTPLGGDAPPVGDDAAQPERPSPPILLD